MKTRTPPRSPHKQLPESAASCQLQQHGPESVRLSGPATAIYCYTLQGCRHLNNRVERVFCTLAGLSFGWSRHYSLETQKAHSTPRTEITNYISMHRRHFSAPGARNREIVLFSPEYRIFFCANQCQMQWSKIDTQVYVLLYSTSNDALNRKEKHTYSSKCGSGNLIRRLLIVRFFTILF